MKFILMLDINNTLVDLKYQILEEIWNFAVIKWKFARVSEFYHFCNYLEIPLFVQWRLHFPTNIYKIYTDNKKISWKQGHLCPIDTSFIYIDLQLWYKFSKNLDMYQASPLNISRHSF